MEFLNNISSFKIRNEDESLEYEEAI